MGIGEPPDGAHADLKHLVGGGGLRANLSGSDLNVLLRQRGDDVGSSEPTGGQPLLVEAESVEPFDWRPAFAVALVLGGTVAFTVGAVATLWPVWAVGLALVAASFLVFEL